jgi:poly(3-hydroxybutyrate) depolymerase
VANRSGSIWRLLLAVALLVALSWPGRASAAAPVGVDNRPNNRCASQGDLTPLIDDGATFHTFTYPAGTGIKRSYIFVPATAGCSAISPCQVVFVLHGGTSNACEARISSQMFNFVSSKTVLVYPNGTHYPEGYGAGPGLNWNDGRIYSASDNGCTDCNLNDHAALDDVDFIARIIVDRLRAIHYSAVSLDLLRRVFAVGVSNGGAMSLRLAKDLKNRITAATSIVGQFPLNLCATTSCGRMAPTLTILGKRDVLMPFAGGGEFWSADNTWFIQKASMGASGVNTSVADPWAVPSTSLAAGYPGSIDGRIVAGSSYRLGNRADGSWLLYLDSNPGFYYAPNQRRVVEQIRLENGGHCWHGSTLNPAGYLGANPGGAPEPGRCARDSFKASKKALDFFARAPNLCWTGYDTYYCPN